MRRIIAVAGLLGIVALVTTSSPAVAEVTPAHGQTQVGIQSFLQRTTVRVGIIQSDMKPIPGTDAPNTGLARPGDRIDVICALWDNRGVQWMLALNRDGHAGQQYSNTVGFIRTSDLFQNFTASHCQDRARRTTTIWVGIFQSDMKPIPGTDAPNTGIARRGDDLAAYCSLLDNRLTRWEIVINRSGRAGQQYANTVGFVPTLDMEGMNATLHCDA